MCDVSVFSRRELSRRDSAGMASSSSFPNGSNSSLGQQVRCECGIPSAAAPAFGLAALLTAAVLAGDAQRLLTDNTDFLVISVLGTQARNPSPCFRILTCQIQSLHAVWPHPPRAARLRRRKQQPWGSGFDCAAAAAVMARRGGRGPESRRSSTRSPPSCRPAPRVPRPAPRARAARAARDSHHGGGLGEVG
jgi:hypothetical protein